MSKEQERARERRRQERVQAAHEARGRRGRRRSVLAAALTALVVLAVVVGLAVRGRGHDPAPLAVASSASTPARQTASPARTTDVPGVPGLRCTTPPPLQARPWHSTTVPDKAAAAGHTFVATIETTCGPITVELDGKDAPQTVASFLQLAKVGYWVSSPCHRLTTSGIYVLQCGDPTGTGSGTPGYGFGIEHAPTDGRYPRGVLAMARTQDPHSNGGQFFVVQQDTTLPTDGGGYSIFGRVTSGLDMVDRIAHAGTDDSNGPGDGRPKAPISILGVSVTEKKA